MCGIFYLKTYSKFGVLINTMRTIFIILMFVAAFWAFYEQSKDQPNKILMILAFAVFAFGLMRLMAKVPGKEERDERENRDEDI